MSDRVRYLVKHSVMSLVATTVVFGTSEIALRVAGFRYLPPEVPLIVWNPQLDLTLDAEGGIHRTAVHQIWAPRPGAVNHLSPGKDVINPAGYRGSLLPTERTPGVLRIATLGDSSTFGALVDVEDTYSARLAKLLDERGVPTEVLNGGVVGFTILQGIQRYRELVRAYRPDIVIAAFGAINEHFPAQDLPDEAKIRRNASRASSWRRGLYAVRDRLRTLQLVNYAVEQMRGGPEAQLRTVEQHRRTQEALRSTSGHVDWPGIRRISVAEFGDALLRLKREVEADGARLVFISMPRTPQTQRTLPVLYRYTEKIHEIAGREGLPLLDGRVLFHEAGRHGHPEEPLFVDAVHPTPLGHELIAAGLVPLILNLRERGSIE